jgi:hypothetical protein
MKTQQRSTELAGQLPQFNWDWVSASPEAVKRYLALLQLMAKYEIPLTPDRLADEALHQHLKQPSFEADMKLLLGKRLLHQPGRTENAALTRQLYEREFGPVAVWDSADCAIQLDAA